MNRPYFGSNNQYGTGGTIVQTTKPNFYSKRQASLQSKKASFSDKVGKRIGRSQVESRKRSGGSGK